jgi:hypothetical protein
MKKKKFNELIQKPLRFHHQDIHEELEELKRMIQNVNDQMQELREAIGRTPISTPKLPMPQPYVHPWWQHQWTGPIPCGDNLRCNVTATGYNSDTAGFGVPGTKKAA